ncbi:hypothetical protein PLESTB_001976500 [Pleodorina starrii]|uniref:Sortase n=1 Tax=Pleodorina starrii TaxID=330485 RepID=A0A9W6FCB9_9CHLO|nr:hypothetical protein PLESTB_001976500 [Pleodorina starrii]
MRHPDQNNTGDDPRPPQARSGRARSLSALAAAAGAAGLLTAAVLLGPGPEADETLTTPPATSPTAPSTVVAPSSTAASTPSPGTPAEPSSVASSSPAPVPGSASPPEPVSPAPGALPAASAPVHLTVPAAGIDQPVLPLSPTAENLAEQSIVPPLTTDAYWLSTYGHPGDGSQNTTYITGHSWEGLDAPFDRLSTQVTPGDTVVLGTETGQISYVVETVTTYDKNSLKDSEIWAIVPNRLVLISCFVQDPWGKNVVVTAIPAA